MQYGIGDILTLLGSLGLFLYGMKVMSDALMELAGDRMRTVLATTTSNRFFAVMTGFLITAAIQSSSATTLMVVSFVNASLLTMTEAVGVIMGANIGTTVTAWLISILGFKLSISSIALPLVGVGFLMALSKKKKIKDWGYFIIGFAVLFIGLQFLKESVPDIRNNPEVLAFLAEYTTKGYLSVLMFMVIGTILTLIVQSSSATMALTLLMCHEGWIPFDMAAAMVLGENVGTTITANLAALVANYQAKRAARAHFIFNSLGVLWVLVLFYPFINIVAGFVEQAEGASPFVSAAAIPVALSLFHTSFNLLNATLLIGFIGVIVKMVEWLVPVEVEEEIEIHEPQFLDEASLKYPQTGVKALTDESLRLLQNAAYKAVAHGLSVHRADLESEQKLKEILEYPEIIQIDIDRFYETRIKRIYGEILEYATRLQSRHTLDEGTIEDIRNILLADRMLVQVVKQMKPLHENVAEFMACDNQAIRREYNVLRRRILKVVRMIHRISVSEELGVYLEKLKNQRLKAEQLDVLVTGRVDKLVLEGEISDAMATSLMNDSVEAARVARKLVDVATLLYTPKDIQMHAIDEHEEEAVQDIRMHAAENDYRDIEVSAVDEDSDIRPES
ncbi:MAG: Na/Pi symporter [Sedimenticola sp.]